MQFNITVQDEAGCAPSVARLIERAIQRTLESLSIGRSLAVVARLISAEQMQALNWKFKKEERPTDVLSFAVSGSWRDGVRRDEQREPEWEELGDAEYLGDLVLCPEVIRRQAVEHSVTEAYEFAKMAVHGTLHLVGYDHATAEEERVMFGKTDDILDALPDLNAEATLKVT